MVKKFTTHIFYLTFVMFFVGCHQNQHINSVNGSNININSSITADSSLIAQITPYSMEVNKKMDRIIGYSDMDLSAKKPESGLSNFIADIINESSANILYSNQSDTLPLFTLINIKGLRAPLLKGPVSIRNIYEIMPFENEIVLLKLTGNQVLHLFNFIAESGGDGISGASCAIKDQKAQQIKINNNPIDSTSYYYLATSDYLANGGDHYEILTKPINRIDTRIKVRDIIINYIENMNKNKLTIHAHTEGRIKK